MRISNACIIACLVSAGCLSDGSESDADRQTSSTASGGLSTSSGTPVLDCPTCPTNTTATHRLEFLECQTIFLFYAVDQAKLAQRMPADYQPSFSATAGLDAFLCKSVVIDNLSVERDVQWFAASTVVDPPDDVEAPGTNLYHFETCINNLNVAAVFRQASFDVCQGEIQFSVMGNVLTISYLQDGVVAYEYTGAGEATTGTNTNQEPLRLHQAADAKRAWVDQDSDGQDSNTGEFGVLSINQGAIGQVTANPGPVTAAHSGIGSGSYVLHFDQQVNP